MMDSSTIICYLRSEKDEKLPFFPKDIPWNSKKWRVWLYFSELRDMMFAGRQYPFSSDRGINYVKDNIKKISFIKLFRKNFSVITSGK